MYDHLTSASWELCLLARGAIEKSIEVLDLDISFYLEKNEDVETMKEGDKKEEEHGHAIDHAIQKSLGTKTSLEKIEQTYRKDDKREHVQHGLAKPPLQVATNTDSVDPSRGFTMTKRTQDGQKYDVTVPLLTLPKKIDDSFEKRLLVKNEQKKNRSHDGDENVVDNTTIATSGRLAARFKRK